MRQRKVEKTANVTAAEWLLYCICAVLVAGYLCVSFHTGIRMEQQQHSDQLAMKVQQINADFQAIEAMLERFKKPGRNKQQRLDEKKQVIDQLRTLEEQGHQLALEYQQYQQDKSLQYMALIYPKAVAQLHQQYIKTLGLKIAVDRYVRTTEQTFFYVTQPKEQQELSREPYWALRWHLDNF